MSDVEENSGGQMELPSHLLIGPYAAARAKEIQIMRAELSTSRTTKMQFQKLPKHMRRRAMSHNTKRLPRRLREIHLSQMKKSGLPPKQKKPSRKYRRKPKSLASEYVRRQKKVAWLDTHIWHAKRFRMVEKWGYKLPECPCDKAFRACYRATSKHCLVQDVSYFKCVEISGKVEVILEGLKKVVDPETGLTFAAKCYIEGKREGNLTLFHSTGFRKAIGNVSFLWKPVWEAGDHERILWIWIHPAFYNEALEALNLCLNLEPIVVDLETSHFLEIYSNSEGIELRELNSELSRFRLTGPLSHSILSDSFKLVKENFPEWTKNQQSSILQQNSFWESIFSSSQLSPSIAIPLLVRDPRFNLPEVRTKALPDVEKYSQSIDKILDIKYMWSGLWDGRVRNKLKKEKISNAEISRMRGEMLVPGQEIKHSNSVPVLLIQRPGNRESWAGAIGYGSGWDIIIPSSYAQTFFISLIMRGARAGGLRETRSIAFEMCRPDFLFPDTISGKQEEETVSQECTDKFFRLPPNKRTNYNKFRSVTPFCCNWNLLNKDWGGNDNFFVLRNKKLLKEIQESLHSKSTKSIPHCPTNCLIPVSIFLNKKGRCKKFSLICLPQNRDFRKEPVESNCKDPLEKERKEMRKNHKALLKKLRKRRIAAKLKGKVIPINKTLLLNYTKKMRKLWLPDATNLRKSCSREIIGFVKHGDFSFQIGRTKAIGYITSKCLSQLALLKCRNKVLVRNTNSKQYRLGTINVICE